MKTNTLRRTLMSAGMSTALVLSMLAAPAAVYAGETALTLEDLKEMDLDALWKTADASTYVSLGDLDLLEVTQYVYVVNDTDVDYEVESMLSEYAETEDAETAEYGDLVTMDLSYVIDGEEFTEADYLVDVGYAEISDAFDEALEGKKVGDEIELTDTFGAEDAPYEEWENQTVEMSAVITAIERTIYPEATDEWVAANTEYENIDALRESLKADLQSYYDNESHANLLQAVITAAMDECTFEGYPQETFDNALASLKGQYEDLADMWGMSLDELYEAYGLSDDELSEEAIGFVNYQLFLAAYGQEQDVTVTADDISAFLNTTYESYEFESPEAMLSEYDVADIAYAVAEEKISEMLLENANISIEEYDYENENLLLDDEWEEDGDDEWEDGDWIGSDDEWEDGDWDDIDLDDADLIEAVG